MLDISVEEDLKAEFAMADFINNDEEALAQIIKHPLTLLGASDGGAHTKFLTLVGIHSLLGALVRDKQVMTLEVGALAALHDGWLGDRNSRTAGFLEGMPADIVVYDLRS